VASTLQRSEHPYLYCLAVRDPGLLTRRAPSTDLATREKMSAFLLHNFHNFRARGSGGGLV